MSNAQTLSPFDRVPTPCIGVCSTVLGDQVCRGCKRYSHEIIHWNSFNEREKRIVDQRLEEFLRQVSVVYLQVEDVDLLKSKIALHNIRVAPHRNAEGHAYELLRAGGDQITVFEEYGLSLTRTAAEMTAVEIKNAIDKDFWQLSSAHYERYFRV